MLKPKIEATQTDRALAKSVNFELTIADIAKRSERRAWIVAFSAIMLALILIGGYFYMLPLKQKVPYVVMADAYTGTSSLARLTNDFASRHITTNDAINRSNVAHFVLARESYDLSTIAMHDWSTVLTMASPGVAMAYRRWVSPQNPDGPYQKYGRKRAIRIKILSIVLMGSGPNRTPKGATVRFQRSLYDEASGALHPIDNKIATMMFAYKPDLQMSDQARIENPLGFQVTSYRVDNDYDTTPPAPHEATPLAEPPASPSSGDTSHPSSVDSSVTQETGAPRDATNTVSGTEQRQ
ncbi:type IV secretion system protein [Dyella sp. A6]|uniref:virB8 family protein n=1 Tax=Dyella aluminiiresistens TaxID=3069105 RepID=UPI002E7689B3|nr:type IV secretion system protein [Dyella sp. A6]